MDEGLAILRSLGDQNSLTFGYNLAAQADLDRADAASAARHLAALLAIGRDIHEQLACARGLEGAAELLAASDPGRAVRLLARARRVRNELGYTPHLREQARVDRWLPTARAALGFEASTIEASGANCLLAAAVDDAIDACTSAALATPTVGAQLPAACAESLVVPFGGSQSGRLSHLTSDDGFPGLR
jgi:hypothetical protein